jgi:hypothetical protein
MRNAIDKDGADMLLAIYSTPLSKEDIRALKTFMPGTRVKRLGAPLSDSIGHLYESTNGPLYSPSWRIYTISNLEVVQYLQLATPSPIYIGLFNADCGEKLKSLCAGLDFVCSVIFAVEQLARENHEYFDSLSDDDSYVGAFVDMIDDWASKECENITKASEKVFQEMKLPKQDDP